MRKGTGGITGAAGSAGRKLLVRRRWRKDPDRVAEDGEFPRAPLSGVLHFAATGTGTFDVPRYDVRVRVDDLFAGDEGIGQVTGRLALRGELLTVEVEAASPRLVISGSGRIAMTDEMDAEMTLRFSNTCSILPCVLRAQLSPFATAVAGERCASSVRWRTWITWR